MTEEKLEEKPDVSQGPAKPVKVEQTPKRAAWLTGEEVLRAYNQSNVEATTSYGQLCLALDSFPKWQEGPRAQFLQKFYGCANELGDKCDEFVKKLLKIGIYNIPVSEQESYIQLLRQVACRHVHHTQSVLYTLIINFMPHGTLERVEDDESEEPAWPFPLPEADQERVYTLIHSAIRQTIRSFPVAAKALKRVVAQAFPHHCGPKLKFCHFYRNVVALCDYIPDEFRSDMWCIAVTHLFPFDTHVSSQIADARSAEVKLIDSGIFRIEKDENNRKDGNDIDSEALLKDRVEVLDKCILYSIAWISRFYSPIVNESNAAELAWLPTLTEEARQKTDLFELFKSVFENELLYSHDIYSIPFIWMYMASKDEALCTKILRHLWHIIIRPSASPNEWKKAQGAACYLAGFLARTSSISLETVLSWLGEMTNWCSRYVNEVAGGLSLTSVGSIRHGTFYAVCQAVFLTICFRYKQIVEGDRLFTMQKWGLGHIVNSYLNPLAYVNRPVALCFSAITRSLQLVYCNILLSIIDESQRPFESFFPFDVCVMPMCKEHVSDCVQKFSPMQNDISLISNEFYRGQITVGKKVADEEMDVDDDPGAFDFMYGDDDVTEVIEVTGGKSLAMNIPTRSQPFTMYAQSPGLCSMEFI